MGQGLQRLAGECMNIFEYFRTALASIASNRLRSFLTMLGIIIGISSVITILSIGEGGRRAVTGEFEKIGVNILEVMVNTNKKLAKNDYFTMNDVKNIKQRIPGVKNASPIFQRPVSLKTEGATKRGFIIAANSELNLIENIEILYGRFLSERDVLTGKNVVVIDNISSKNIFGYEDSTGKTIRIGNRANMINFRIIGIYKNIGGVFADSFSDSIPIFVYIPITCSERLFPNDFNIGTIEVLTSGQKDSDKAAEGIIKFLESTHHNKDKYKAESMIKQLEQVNRIINIFTMVIGAIAGISLIVGGIGVMNIMLVSVSERTREIGIRKAIGAKRRDILTQFLIESVIISSIGGVFGMMLGILAAYLIGAVLKIAPVVSILTIIIAFLFSSAVGIFFGIYPANKASMLDPIEALRYE